ncbi:ABC transporter [Yasminevirus sp. GU-2018]|uniref:ABC transporter n=1 Tax=Yasminevirus sp. GU-2018 TaxID=2420051 RepID=A0A5K0UAG2_9VIRU|nr:ABC transporter [Yasminevirus sp. GU-2018]
MSDDESIETISMLDDNLIDMLDSSVSSHDRYLDDRKDSHKDSHKDNHDNEYDDVLSADSSSQSRQTSKRVEKIDINSIFWDALMQNKIIIFATFPLFVGYYLQDTIFTRSIAEVTSDIPGFVADIDVKKVLIVMLPYIVALILFYISNIIMAKSTTRIELMAIQSLTDKLIESIKTTKKPINVNDLILHIKKIGDTKHIYNIVMTYILPTLIVGFGLVYNFVQGDGYYGLLVAIILIVMMLVTTKLELDSISHAYNTETSVNVLYDEIHEIMTNIDSVLTSNTQEQEIENLQATKNKTYDLACLSSLNNNNTTYGLQAISIASMLGINYLSYRLYSQSKITGPLFTATVLMSLLFMDYYNYCIHAIGDLINSMGRFKEMKKYFGEFKIIKLPEEEKSRQLTLKVSKGDINIKNLTLKYEGKTVFSDFNLAIKGNTVTGLVGPIGSGKTTLLKMLAGITEYNGDVLIDNQPLAKCTYESIVENVAYISQHPKLFNKSIYYNINYGSCYSKEEILKKLDQLGLMPFINSFPQKLDTVVGKEGSKVSGGQKQFIALIRSLIQDKSILLLDEPSSSLDITNKNLFIKLIKNIKNKTIIISTHDKFIMSLFGTIIDVSKAKNKKNSKPDKGTSVEEEMSRQGVNNYEQERYTVEMYR